jgi:hypothetical protein
VKPAKRGAIIGALVIGLGLALAPLAFQMFDRAPQGAEMIDEFRPYMTPEQVELFQGYLTVIGAADAESQEVLAPTLADAGLLDDRPWAEQFPLVATFNEQWPAIDADMSDLLATMERNLDNFGAVDALPSFQLFPWFFVLPGLAIAAVAAAALVVGRKRAPRTLLVVLAVLGFAVALAPAVFQMFSRAPAGGEMIDDFRPMMVRERVRNVQGYFITIGTAEGQLRTAVLPLAQEQGLDLAEVPSVLQLNEDWPTMVGELAAMVGVMSDNVDNFEAVDAMPDFPLFPWFFVVPGLLVAGLALWARAGRAAAPPPGGQAATVATESPPTESARR